jgi:hypothetical protein
LHAQSQDGAVARVRAPESAQLDPALGSPEALPPGPWALDLEAAEALVYLCRIARVWANCSLRMSLVSRPQMQLKINHCLTMRSRNEKMPGSVQRNTKTAR